MFFCSIDIRRFAVYVGAIFFIFMFSFLCQNSEETDILKVLIGLAEKGDISARYQLGNFYFNVEGNGAKAYQCYKQAADKGFAEAQIALGNMYLEGYSEKGLGQPAPRSARKYFLLAAEQGNPEAMQLLSYLHGNDNDESNEMYNANEAINWQKKAQEHGYIEDSVYNPGLLYRIHSSLEDRKKTIDWYEIQAERGDPDAYNILGIRYAKAYGFFSKKTLECFEKAAAKDCIDGQYNLALVLASGSELSFFQKIGLAKKKEEIFYSDRPRSFKLFVNLLRQLDDGKIPSSQDPDGLRASILYYLLKFKFTKKNLVQARN